MTRFNKTLVLIAALAVTRLAATPAFGQSFSRTYGTGNILPFSYEQIAPDVAVRHAGARAARRNGLDAYAMEPRPQSNFNSARHLRVAVVSDTIKISTTTKLRKKNGASFGSPFFLA